MLDQAVKTYYKGQMIVKVPLSSGGGDLYFTKSDNLEVRFIRRVNLDDNKYQFNGYDEFINMNNFKYLKINYSQGKEISRIGSNVNKNDKGSNQIRSNNYYEGSWLGALFYCIGNYIIAIPKREGNGWSCYGPGNVNPQETQTFIIADSGGSQFNWAAWYLFYQPTYNNIIGPSDPWLPYYGGNYDPNNPPAYMPPPGGVNPIDPGLIQQPVSEFFELSPPYIWNYEGDDGTTFNDTKPNDEPYIDFHPMDQSNILAPKFVSLVKNLRSFVKNNSKVMSALQKWSGFSKQEILNSLEYRYGNGPQVYVSGTNTVGVFGKYNHKNSPGVLFIDPVTVDKYQQSQLNSKEGDALAFMLSIIVLHEFTHYGTNLLGVRNTGRFKFKETGYAFEEMLFDVTMTEKNLSEVYIQFIKR